MSTLTKGDAAILRQVPGFMVNGGRGLFVGGNGSPVREVPDVIRDIADRIEAETQPDPAWEELSTVPLGELQRRKNLILSAIVERLNDRPLPPPLSLDELREYFRTEGVDGKR